MGRPHLDLHAAAVWVGVAPAGFSPSVAVAALEFALVWQVRTEGLATLSEQHADGLRTVLADWVETDHGAAALLVSVLGLLREVR